MAQSDCVLLTQCLAMVHQFVDSRQRLTISVRIGNEFSFDFSNQDSRAEIVRKKLSPSQMKRNQLRNFKRIQNLVVSEQLDASGSYKTDVGTNTDADDIDQDFCETKLIVNDSSTQTRSVEHMDCAVNTETIKHDEELKLDKHGHINPQEGEAVLEIRVAHDARTWEDVGLIIKKTLGISMIGRPWIANNGKLFKTIGFRTMREEYEKWKLKTYNWQESGVRSVSFSTLYR